jgi:hypothetical protein
MVGFEAGARTLTLNRAAGSETAAFAAVRKA